MTPEITFHVKHMFSKKRQTGNKGEDIAVFKLAELGYEILDRNYLKKWGEIDIVARGTDQKLHFIEVKSVTRENLNVSDFHPDDVFMPEENVTREKILKLERAINSWIQEHKYSGDWQIDVVTIEMDMKRKMARFKHLENIS